MFRWTTSILAGIALIPINNGFASEWWQDRFAVEGSETCEDNDSIQTYSPSEANAWEQSCKIVKQQKIKQMNAVILDLDCNDFGESDPDGDGMGRDIGQTQLRQLIVREDDDAIRIYPDGRRYERCSAIKKTSDVCPVSHSVFMSESRNDGNYQLLEFPEGVSQGAAKLTGYVNYKPAWVSNGSATCTNGTFTCSLHFPTMRNGDVTEDYRPLVVGKENWLVFAAFRANVYLKERQTTFQVEPAYGGLRVDLLNDYIPGKDELILPDNVYKFSECKPTTEKPQQ